MSRFIYSIFDLKGSCHDRVFCCVHDSDAVRLFDQLVLSQGSPYRDYGEDYVLCLIGSFDPSSGSLVSLPVRQLATVMERQVFFEAVQRIRQAKVESAVRDHEAHTKVESAACDHEALTKVESAACDHEAHTKVESAACDHEAHTKVESAACDHEAHTKVESAACDHEAHTKVESAACDHEATKKVPILIESGNVSSSDDFEPIGGFLGDF